MNFAVIGAGNAGQAMAAHLTILGHNVILYNRTREKLEEIKSRGITITNALDGKAKVRTSHSIKATVENADFIMITVPAPGHFSVANDIKPYIKEGQIILVFAGYWGALEFYSVLSEDVEKKGIIIGETDTMIYTCRICQPGVVDVKRMKKNVSLACINEDDTLKIISLLKSIYPQLTPAENVLETSLNNFNPILHSPTTIFNAGRIDFGDDFFFYAQGAPPRCVRYIQSVDDERMKIGKALGVKMTNLRELLNKFYERQDKTLYDFIHLNPAYQREKGPTSLDDRYLTEEIPFGLVPIAKLGERLKIKTPYIDALINVASLLMERDFSSESINIATLVEQFLQK